MLGARRFLTEGGGGAQKKGPFFSYVWLQKVHLKLQPVCSHGKRLTRPVESWCLIDEELSALDESLVAIGGAPKKQGPLFSYVWLQKVHLKLQPVCSHGKRLTRPVESWCLIDEELSALDESLVAICRKPAAGTRELLPKPCVLGASAAAEP